MDIFLVTVEDTVLILKSTHPYERVLEKTPHWSCGSSALHQLLITRRESLLVEEEQQQQQQQEP